MITKKVHQQLQHEIQKVTAGEGELDKTMCTEAEKTNLFNKDVSSLLYAYGDVPQPLQATVQCLDELVCGYLVDVCTNAFHTAQNSFNAISSDWKISSLPFVKTR